MEALRGVGILLGYFVAVLALLLLTKRFIKVPQELTRKILHLMIASSVFVWLYGFQTWYVSATCAAVLAALVYPLLTLAERIPQYSVFLAERRTGEVKTSGVVVFIMLAVLIAIFWGALGPDSKYIIVVAIMAWGFGDAAAALIGKTYGRHFITHRLIEGKKTLEGTASMFGASLFAIFVTTLLYTGKPWFICLAIGLMVAPASALVELYTKRGMDTITVPLAVAGALSVVVNILGRFGV